MPRPRSWRRSARPGKAVAYQADVSDGSQVEEMFASIEADLGPVAVLVNNAGITADNLLLRMSSDDFDRVIATNLKSVYFCTRLALRPMLKARWGGWYPSHRSRG